MINTDLIVRSAQALVDQRSDEDIYMTNFMSIQNINNMNRELYKSDNLDTFICDTATCWAGSLPFLDIGTDELKPIKSDWQGNGTLNFIRYSMRVLEIDDELVWEFLFNSDWPNSTKACLERAEFLKANDDTCYLRPLLEEYAYNKGVKI